MSRKSKPTLFAWVMCVVTGRHYWREYRNEDGSSYAICDQCGERRDPVPREDGCTPVWNPDQNGYKCRYSHRPVAAAWRSHVCPNHQRMEAEQARELNTLDDFLLHPGEYNLAHFYAQIRSAMQQHADYLPGCHIALGEHRSVLSLHSVLTWCLANPQPAERLNEAIDLMLPGSLRNTFVLMVNTVRQPIDPTHG